ILSRDAPKQGLMLYWLYYYFNRHVGKWVLELDGTAPYHVPSDKGLAGPLTPVLGTLSEDGRTIHLVIANGSATRAVPCSVALRNFDAATAAGVTLSQRDLDAHPLVNRTEDAVGALRVELAPPGAAFTVPPQSVVFVSLRRAAG
ncbi:MAG: hypothetical protein WBF17_10275, partial [Phycisphaerae bacterium]